MPLRRSTRRGAYHFILNVLLTPTHHLKSLCFFSAGGCFFSGDGGGLYIYGGTPTISGCTIDGNEADDNGGGMYLTRSDGSAVPNEGWTSATPPVVIVTAASAGEDA